MALRTPEKSKELNPGQADADRKFAGIAKSEEAGTFDDIAKNYNQTADPSQENAISPKRIMQRQIPAVVGKQS